MKLFLFTFAFCVQTFKWITNKSTFQKDERHIEKTWPIFALHWHILLLFIENCHFMISSIVDIVFYGFNFDYFICLWMRNWLHRKGEKDEYWWIHFANEFIENVNMITYKKLTTNFCGDSKHFFCASLFIALWCRVQQTMRIKAAIISEKNADKNGWKLQCGTLWDDLVESEAPHKEQRR